jgi:hypothetical protein
MAAMADFKPIYRSSWSDAKEHGEQDEWRESQMENIRCRDFLDALTQKYYSGNTLASEEIIKAAVAEFGWDRINWVLASHVQHYDYDGRFSPQNKAWAQGFYIPRPADWEKKRDPYLRDYTTAYLLDSHNTLVDGLVYRVQRMYDGLNLYDHRHCEAGDIHTKEFKDRLLILRDTSLKESARTPENQLFLADIGGFGCHPNARGRSVMGHFLVDGERATFNRNEFCGIADPEQLPEWAAVKLHELQNPAESTDETESADITMKGM